MSVNIGAPGGGWQAARHKPASLAEISLAWLRPQASLSSGPTARAELSTAQGWVQSISQLWHPGPAVPCCYVTLSQVSEQLLGFRASLPPVEHVLFLCGPVCGIMWEFHNQEKSNFSVSDMKGGFIWLHVKDSR